MTIELAYDITISGSLTTLSISADELYGDVGLYIDANGSFQTYSTTKADDLTLSLDDTTVSTDSETTVDFLIPSESSTTLTAELEMENITYEAELTADNEAWNAGYQYTYPITLPDDTSGFTLTEETSEDVDGHYAVDLGVSVKWASMNVGADSHEDYGNYYSWGETETKDEYNQSTTDTWGVELGDISGNSEYDAATANWGDSWQMPTSDEIDELVEGCAWEWTTLNDTNGYLVTGTNCNYIFLPAAGFWQYSSLANDGIFGVYWSSTPSETYYHAYYLLFLSGNYVISAYPRYLGCPVRPVVATSSEEE